MSSTPQMDYDAYRLLVQEVKDYAIFMLDPKGKVLSWNAGAQRLKGYTPEEIIGKHFSIFYPKADVLNKKPQRELEIASIEGRVEDEGWRLRKDGTRFWANVVLTALHDDKGKLRGFAKITRDMTERRRAEDGLRDQAAQLEKRVQERTLELEKAN
ncbi:MAG TPA: PAS domain S-box protein, partial [Terriglobia bacterium]|nr:PAS domain S-box protein [Terriglobia bacterium]